METHELTIMVAGSRVGASRSHPDYDRRELTVREYARHERVTERTVWTWIRKEAVHVRRTPGGRVRIVLK